MGKQVMAPLERDQQLDGTIGAVTDKDKQKSKKKVDPKREAISKHLKEAYRSVVDEPLPDMFEDLLRQLDESVDLNDTKGQDKFETDQ